METIGITGEAVATSSEGGLIGGLQSLTGAVISTVQGSAGIIVGLLGVSVLGGIIIFFVYKKKRKTTGKKK
jgi:hypothetical protein